MKRVLSALLVCVILVSGIVILRAWRDYSAFQATRVQEPRLAPSLADRYHLEWRWQTEQEWIVADVLDAIVNMSTFAAKGTVETHAVVTRDPGEAQRFGMLARIHATLPDGEAGLVNIDDHIWAPAAYAPHAGRLLGGRRTTCGPAALEMIDTLTRIDAGAFVRENARLSTALQHDMSCGATHEEAALLIGAFAMREAAGRLTDPRRLISRMTAHLAMADALGAGNGVVRRLDDSILLTLVGRQKAAMEALAPLEQDTTTPGVAAWVRALRTRITVDWRIVADPLNASPIEQIERARAVEAMIDEDAAFGLVESVDDGRSTGFPRSLKQYNVGVMSGHRYADEGLAREIAELNDAREAFGLPKADSRESVIEALNAEPAAGPVQPGGAAVWVIDPGMWAAASQRHFAQALIWKHWFLANALAVQQEDTEFRQDVVNNYARLRLFPAIERQIALTQIEYDRAMTGAIELSRLRPELVTDAIWTEFLWQSGFGKVPDTVPPSTAWFKPFFLPGTVFDVVHRPFAVDGLPRLTFVEIEKARGLAPWARPVIYQSVRYRYQNHATFDQLQKEYGDMPSYDVLMARHVASQAWNDEDRYVSLMKKVAAIKPDLWSEIAEYLADRGHAGDARAAWERYVAVEPNSIGMSGRSWWLVRYYHDHGERAKAERLADLSAETYSYSGLVTRADLYDWRGDDGKAEVFYRKAYERYQNGNDLLAFYLRHHRTGAQVDSLAKTIFPQGLTRLPNTASAEPPDGGVIVRTLGFSVEKNGLKAQDLIVAVDGIRVRNYEQYRVARWVSQDPDMRLTIWRNGRYVELKTKLRYNWISGTIQTFGGTKSAN